LLKRMQEAIDDARGTQVDSADAHPGSPAPGQERAAEPAADPEPLTEPLTEPLPNLQAALAELTNTGQTSRPADRDRGAKPERGSRSDRARRRDSSSRPNGGSPFDKNGQPAPAGLSAPGLPVQIWPPAQGVQSAQIGLIGSAAETSQSPRQPPTDQEPPDRPSSPGETTTTARTALPGTILPPARAGRSATRRTATVPAPPPPARRRAHRRGPRVATAAALAVIAIAAGGIAIVLSSRTSGGSSQITKSHRQGPPSLATRTAKLAASWVAGQVSHDAYVACDKAMCDALTAHGFPGRKLQLIGLNSPYPLHAQVVVVTPVVQRQFGSSLANEWAPTVLTSVGSGATAISIRVVSPQGAAAYQSALRTDVQQRKVFAQFLLRSPQVTASAPVKKELAGGQVDARLIVVLTALAAVHPIDILGFGTVFPGASAGVPMRVAQLADPDPASGLNRADYLRYLLTLLHKQSYPFLPEAAWLAHASSGKLIFQIKFAAPGQLLLLGR